MATFDYIKALQDQGVFHQIAEASTKKRATASVVRFNPAFSVMPKRSAVTQKGAPLEDNSIDVCPFCGSRMGIAILVTKKEAYYCDICSIAHPKV